ncbi:MAG: helix-turn-helix domain-containing protein [Pseudomonadota bacterium]
MARILIVSDRIQAAQGLDNILRGFGHEVVGVAATLDKALALALECRATIAFVDMMLQSGQGAVAAASALKGSAQTSIIFTTSRADPDTLARVDAANPDGYVLEPFSPDAVFNVISSAIQHSRRANDVPTDLERVAAPVQTWNELPLPIMQRIATYVGENLDGEITLRGLSDLCGMSESSFSRRFKATKGQTPYQYVMSARLTEAKRLLKDTHLPLVDVAVATGFSSQSHFATTFKKAMNQTPLQYRRS